LTFSFKSLINIARSICLSYSYFSFGKSHQNGNLKAYIESQLEKRSDDDDGDDFDDN
jgi:hypothetical protein